MESQQGRREDCLIGGVYRTANHNALTPLAGVVCQTVWSIICPTQEPLGTVNYAVTADGLISVTVTIYKVAEETF